MSLLALAGTNSATGGYDIDNSLKFESDNAEYLMAEGRSQGNQQTWTFSIWLKRTEVNNGFVAQYIMSAGSDGKLSLYFRDDASYPGDRIFIYMDEGNAQKWVGQVNESFRDPSAWYHLVFTCDTTDSTPADRTKLYINGEQRTITYNATMNVNTSTRVGDSGGKFALGARIATPGYNFNGYMAEAVLVDGSALTPTSFGEYDDDSGIWKPKDVSSLSLGTTGFHMNFDDSSNVGAVQRGNNGGNFDKYNLSAADQATDTPTNNFCTLNVVQASSKNAGGNNEYTEGATKGKALQESEMASGTMAVTQGKWYYECKAVTNSQIMAGWGVPNLWGHHTANPGYDDYSFAVHNIGRVYYSGNAFIDLSPSVSFDTNDIVSCAIDIDNGFCYWAKNGTWMNGGVPTSGSTGTGGFDFQSASAPGNLDIADGDFLIPAFRTNYYTNSAILVNFGGFTTISISSAESDADGYGTFEYAPPSGYYSLCTKNLEEYG